VIASRDAIERQTGYRCDGCPWRGFTDPIVSDVLEAYGLVGGEGPLALLPEYLPHHLHEGVRVYRRVINAVQSHDAEARRRRRESR
jgi:hypothetical protein